ncbi:heat shock factor 2-binding protein [Brachionichthys hirsutus]|uniref:heat shock factor 2-binding protein n=1 Tax=Brachionichthys hirsutus TaxID=412623 RepID=UPI0036047D4B
MAASFGGKAAAERRGPKDHFVKVKKRDLDKLTTEVMQLREFLPGLLRKDLIKMLHKGQEALTMNARLARERLHLQFRLDVALAECQMEREEKLKLRERLWRDEAELKQQADFCADLGSAACGLLWSNSAREDAVTHWVADGTLQPFLKMATLTLERFLRSLDEEMKTQTERRNSNEWQSVLAVTGTVSNIAAVTCGRDFLSAASHALLAALMKMLQLMKPGFFPKLQVLALMALYNVSISVKGLKYVIENEELLPLIRTLLDDVDWEVCFHSLRLLQSVMLDEQMLLLLRSSLLEHEFQAGVGRLASSQQPCLKAIAQQTLEELQALAQVLEAPS